MTNVRRKKPIRGLLAALGLHLALLFAVIAGGGLLPEPVRRQPIQESSIQLVSPAVPDPPAPVVPSAPPPPAPLPSEAVSPDTLAPIPAEAALPPDQPQLSEAPAEADLDGLTASPNPKDAGPAPAEVVARPVDALPKAGEIQMQAYLGRYQIDSEPLGTGSLTVAFPAPDRYEIRLTAKARGWAAVLVREEVLFLSEGRLTPDGLVPERFESKTPFRGTVRSHFDQETQKAKLQEKQPPLDMPPGAQDRLSVIFQLAWIGQTQPEALDYGARHTLTVAGSREFRAATFSVEGRDDLVLPGGILISAIRLVSDRIQGRREGHIEVWLDPSDRYLPARMLFQETTGQALDFLAIRPMF